MDVLTNLGMEDHGLQQRWREILRMRRSKSYALNSGNICYGREETGKVPITRTVGIHVLPQQRHLLETFARYPSRFFENALRLSGSLPSARIRNDAETAKVVAAAHDGDPSVHPRNARGNNVIIRLVFGKVDLQGFHTPALFLSMNGIANQHRQLAIGIWAGQKIYQRLLFSELYLEILRHATQDADDQRPTLLKRPEVGKVGVHLR